MKGLESRVYRGTHQFLNQKIKLIYKIKRNWNYERKKWRIKPDKSVIYQNGVPGSGNKEIINDFVKWFLKIRKTFSPGSPVVRIVGAFTAGDWVQSLVE